MENSLAFTLSKCPEQKNVSKSLQISNLPSKYLPRSERYNIPKKSNKEVLK